MTDGDRDGLVRLDRTGHRIVVDGVGGEVTAFVAGRSLPMPGGVLFTRTLSEGVHRVVVRVVDAGGGISREAVWVRVDRSPPQISVQRRQGRLAGVSIRDRYSTVARATATACGWEIPIRRGVVDLSAAQMCTGTMLVRARDEFGNVSSRAVQL